MNEQQLKEAFIQYLQLKSGALTQQEFEAYVQQLGEQGLQLEYAQFMQLLQLQQVLAAKFGAKLNYILKLRGVCPEGYEMQFFKQGGQICKKCVQKAKMMDGGKTKNPIESFKERRKLNGSQYINRGPRNVIEGTAKSGVSNFDPNTTQLPSRNADGVLTPNRLRKVSEGSNNLLIPKKPIQRNKCGNKMKKKACGGNLKKKN